MGNKTINEINPFNLNIFKNNQNNQNVQVQNQEQTNQIPYSYTPEEENELEEETEKNKRSKLKCIKIIKGHYKWCNSLIELKSGNLASCSGDRSINIYSNDNQFNVILRLLSCHEDFIIYIDEIFDSILASSSSDGTIKFWKLFIFGNDIKLNKHYLIQTIQAHEHDPWKFLYINNLKHLISCGSDSLIKIWKIDLDNKDEEKIIIDYDLIDTLRYHKYWITSVIQVINQEKNINYLVSGSGDISVKFYDINNNYNFVHSMDRVLCCQQGTLVNFDNKKFLIGGGRGYFFFVINFITFQIVNKVLGFNEEVNTILVLKKSNLIPQGGIILGGKECNFNYFDEITYINEIIKKDAHEKYIYCIIQLGNNLIASSSYDNAIKIWKYDENTFPKSNFFLKNDNSNNISNI